MGRGGISVFPCDFGGPRGVRCGAVVIFMWRATNDARGEKKQIRAFHDL